MVSGRCGNTRREIIGTLAGCGSVLALALFLPASAPATALVSRWSGFASPPRWRSFNLVTGDTIVLQIEVAGISVDAIFDSSSVPVKQCSRWNRLIDRAETLQHGPVPKCSDPRERDSV